MNRINFRFFNEILGFEGETGASVIAFVIDQSHNMKGKIEATLQTVTMSQELYAKASLADRGGLASRQSDGLGAELLRQDAFARDARPPIELWRTAKGRPGHRPAAFRESGYLERVTRERSGRPTVPGSSYA